MKYKPKMTLSEILQSSSILKNFWEKINYLSKLNSIVVSCLPHPANLHLKTSNVREGILYLQVPSPIWAHESRFLIPELLSKLRQYPEFSGLKSIKIKVAPIKSDILKAPLPSAIPISLESRSLVEKTANTITSPRLKESLLRLATNKILN
ncbi:MAG: uncharacterized protein JWM09_156 [Francisellaceae bacterium]|nr:uncharacterized protein [Francisellaceae bacterium]